MNVNMLVEQKTGGLGLDFLWKVHFNRKDNFNIRTSFKGWLIQIQTYLYLFHIFFSEIPVEIIRPPQDILEAPGTDVVFWAELNKDKVEVQWLRNNMIIVQGDKHQMMSEGKIHRLQICDIRPRDQGEYRFIAKDKEARAKLELAGKSLSIIFTCPRNGTETVKVSGFTVN